MAENQTGLPDRLSLDPQSPYFDSDVLERGIGIKFNGQEKTNVQEYCISEGWIKVAAGRSERMGGVDKVFTELVGRPLVTWALGAFKLFNVMKTLEGHPPRTNFNVFRLDGKYNLRIAEVTGRFPWHCHTNGDEGWLILKGGLQIDVDPYGFM